MKPKVTELLSEISSLVEEEKKAKTAKKKTKKSKPKITKLDLKQFATDTVHPAVGLQRVRSGNVLQTAGFDVVIFDTIHNLIQRWMARQKDLAEIKWNVFRVLRFKGPQGANVKDALSGSGRDIKELTKKFLNYESGWTTERKVLQGVLDILVAEGRAKVEGRGVYVVKPEASPPSLKTGTMRADKTLYALIGGDIKQIGDFFKKAAKSFDPEERLVAKAEDRKDPKEQLNFLAGYFYELAGYIREGRIDAQQIMDRLLDARRIMKQIVGRPLTSRDIATIEAPPRIVPLPPQASK